MNYTDKDLSAYLDGELSAELSAKIDQALQFDSALKTRLSELKNADQMVRMAYGPIAEEAVPASVTALFPEKMDGHDQPAPPPAYIVSSAQRFASWPTALAASVALVIGIAIGEFSPGSDREGTALRVAAVMTPGDPLFAALEKNFSGDAVTLDAASNLVATPVLSFALEDGRLCREFVVATGNEGIRGVACRTENAWETVIAVKSGQDTLLDNQYRAASAASEPLISLYLDNAMAGDAFGRDDEDAFIANGWAFDKR